MNLSDLPTPCLLLDRAVLTRNCQAMSARMASHGVRLRPHLKTAKSADVAAIATAGQFGGLTVSTLAEARYFADRGWRDLTYAVGIVPDKLDQVFALADRGVRLTVLCDCPAVIAELAARTTGRVEQLPVMIEIDCGGARGGVDAESDDLLALGREIDQAGGLALEGVLTHAGQSYDHQSSDEIGQVAEDERRAVARAAERLRAAGFPCPVVSAGSTPTARFATSLEGVTEMRPGVYMFFDLDQMGRGVCRREDIALSVLASVIGHNQRTGRIVIDAGALALSKDLGASRFLERVGYGLVCAPDSGDLFGGLYIASVHQEHGLVATPDGAPPPYNALPVGSRVRVLPNHACLTAAGHDHYHLVDGAQVLGETWSRASGW